ncbi:ATP-binding protein [Larsenimonas rhizosphaerae]|uniref:histidine kinase n=1 Tax=Larsenimonas rhizosphaerae TaxID=2944682 RepID=A0AA42CSM7_9GAMM|nr:ATP-binding protein [Larsenimonas rhizosphaerae]MCX2522712.1 ATP-binding protein [Larsenimonas rhizosphaerae]
MMLIHWLNTLRRRRWRLSGLIALVSIVLIGVTLAGAFWLFNGQLVESLEQAQGDRVGNLALTIAERPDVISALSDGEPQPLARDTPLSPFQQRITTLRQALGVDFIVVMSQQAMRLTHPRRERIGHHFIGGDEVRALSLGEHYVSRAEGSLGISLRGFAPVIGPDGRQLGAVSVGVTMSRLTPLLDRNRWRLGFTLALIGAVGAYGALWLARTVKRRLLDMEPDDIAHVVQQRQAMLDAMQDGVLAVDAEGRVTLLNPAGRRLLSRLSRPLPSEGVLLDTHWPELACSGGMTTDQGREHQTLQLDAMTLLISYRPILWRGHQEGALMTFRDKNDVHVLAEELTGVRRYAEALRASTHEFKNKIHVIHGLAHLGDLPALREYLKALADHRISQSSQLTGDVQEPALAGFLLGKQSEARERGVQFDIRIEQPIDIQRSPRVIHDLVTILGNIIDNAFEALDTVTDRSPMMVLTMDREGDSLSAHLQDNGPGIAPSMQSNIFARGVSTRGANRGLGLSLVQERLETAGGDLALYSTPGEGTLIEITYPYWSDDDAEKH